MHPMRLLVVRSVLVLLVCLFGCAPEAVPTEAPSIAPQELSELQAAGNAPVVIDVRSAKEFAAGHIPGALHIPYDVVAERISEVDAPNGVALYCMVGPRARKGEASLLAAGFGPVFHVEGGFSAWKEAGLPIAPGS